MHPAGFDTCESPPSHLTASLTSPPLLPSHGIGSRVGASLSLTTLCGALAVANLGSLLLTPLAREGGSGGA